MYAWPEILGGFWMGRVISINHKPLISWSHPPGSNRRPADYESAALPTELGWPVIWIITNQLIDRSRITWASSNV
jgi:hypothetical protein